ncbi:hypothetical protein [Pleomorphovibrio marinus]|uniref:hypothetical protein n=1 Tax=Pleomorphovibrio marinus TaxID=2164132 RepID=UPI000E0A08AB|nr:hypothetical protein [Pleomorphovibrio marinus]
MFVQYRRYVKVLLLLCIPLFSGCEREEHFGIPRMDGLLIYWDHSIFGTEGRSYRFSFSYSNHLENQYNLVFIPKIKGNTITITLARVEDRGKCPWFPMPTPAALQGLCQSHGLVEIPDTWLTESRYKLRVVTPYFSQEGNLYIGATTTTLEIPDNPHLSSSITEVYPIPKQLLMGSVVFKGAENLQVVEKFKSELANLGLVETSIPDYPYRHLMLGEDGGARNESWEPDNFSVGLLYKLTADLRTVVELAKTYYENYDLNIFLYSSWGDEARFSQQSGIHIRYAKPVD